MNRIPHRIAVGAALCATAALSLFAALAHAAATHPPETPVKAVRDTLHGVVIEDPYRWLEDKDSPETRAWVKAQMEYTQARLAETPGAEDTRRRLASLSKVDVREAPLVRGTRLFFRMRGADQQQEVIAMRDGADGADVTLIDPNPLDPEHMTAAEILDVSPDGKLLAYGVRHGGEDETDVRLYDVDARKELQGGLPRASYVGVAIAPDRKSFWYARLSEKDPGIYLHRIGDDAAKDKLVYAEHAGASEIPTVSLSDDGRWVIAATYVGSAGDDVRIAVLDAAKGGRFTSVTRDLHERVRLDAAGGKFVIHTTWKAPKGRICVADPRDPSPEHWQEIVPERSDAVIEDFALASGRIVVRYLRHATAQLATFALDGKALGDLALPGLGSCRAVAGQFASGTGFCQYESYATPPTILRFDAGANTLRDWWHSNVPFDAAPYETRTITYFSKDGTKVSMFVVQPKGMEYDGSHPVLLTGYGGFNVSITPHFSAKTAAWLQMGGVFAEVNLRGGGENGDAWHRAGMLDKKQNVFDDFLYAAQWLLTHGYCTQQKLAIEGGSNGGLLVGAALTQRPDLFGAVVCEVPLLDMLRYHRFLVGRFWIPEYGSADDAQQFPWLYAYSPYHHVKAGTKYPATLFVSGDSDTRVDPCHARKMAALLQTAQGGDAPVLLHYDTTSGHSGGQSIDKAIADETDILQFLRAHLGMITH